MITQAQIDAALDSIPPGELAPRRSDMRKALEAAEVAPCPCERNHLDSPATITLPVSRWIVLAGWMTGSGGTELPAFVEQLLEAIGVAVDVALDVEL